jgi:hypothetical protein
LAVQKHAASPFALAVLAALNVHLQATMECPRQQHRLQASQKISSAAEAMV